MISALDYAMSREEVAEELGISRSRVEQIEKHALKKLGRRMAGYVKPLEPKPKPVADDNWESKYDRLYRECLACEPKDLVGRKADEK